MVDDLRFLQGQKPVFLKHFCNENFAYIPYISLRTRLCWVICILFLDFARLAISDTPRTPYCRLIVLTDNDQSNHLLHSERIFRRKQFDIRLVQCSNVHIKCVCEQDSLHATAIGVHTKALISVCDWLIYWRHALLRSPSQTITCSSKREGISRILGHWKRQHSHVIDRSAIVTAVTLW